MRGHREKLCMGTGTARGIMLSNSAAKESGRRLGGHDYMCSFSWDKGFSINLFSDLCTT